jgi:hypothetical protein
VLSGNIHLGTTKTAVQAFIDSGAGGNFIHTSFVTKYGIPLVKLQTPITLSMGDNSPSNYGPVTHETVPLQLHVDSHIETITLLVTTIPTDMILGMPWLKLHNPSIDWTDGQVTFQSTHCIPACCDDIMTVNSMHQDQIPKPDSFTEMSTETIAAINQDSTTIATPPSDLLTEFAEVFSEAKADILPEHRPFDCAIDLNPGSAPPKSRVYNLTGPEDEAMRRQLSKNLARSFIRPSSSPYSSAAFFRKKKEYDTTNNPDDLRMCIDYRALNAQTKTDRYPLPLISDLIRSISKGKIFTALDLRGAYNLLRIRTGDEEKTAFVTKYGQFEFLVMPFGLKNAPPQFQRMMDHIFAGKNFVAVYLDDIVIYSNSEEEHWDHVRAVLQILKDNKLYCKWEKCQFGKSEIKYLGYIVSGTGVRMDPSKVSAVTEWPTPKTVKELQSFLGFTNFYRRLIPEYAKLTQPLTNLLKKEAKFDSQSFPAQAFDDVKQAFLTSTVLAHPDESKPYIVETDASDYAISGILSQFDHQNELRPVAFYSRQMLPAERNYEIYDKELLAIYACFTQWRHFLQGARNPVTVLTDHNNLTYFMSTKQLTKRQVRWAEFFADFNFTITHRPGVRSGKPDLLSRRPDYYVKEEPTNFMKLLHAGNVTAPMPVTSISYECAHRRMGHIGETVMQRSLPAVSGIEITGKKSDILCEPCVEGKRRQQTKGPAPHRELEVLEVIETDVQGPFPTYASDNTRYNVKFIDKKSGYCYMSTISNREAATIATLFKDFQRRMERLTNQRIKYVCSDQGTEYMGAFKKHLKDEGIIKLTGIAYDHTYPPKVERAHQTILQWGRSMLLDAKLSECYYSDAQLMATYIFNRTVHGEDSKTPFEYIYRRKPNLSHLRPFGCVAYALIPKETRTKLDASRTRCRLLGYLDTGDAEEFWGYKLLRESDLAVIFSNDVVFDEKVAPTPLDIDEETAEAPDEDQGEELRVPHYQRTLVNEKNIIGDMSQRTLRGGKGGGSQVPCQAHAGLGTILAAIPEGLAGVEALAELRG